MTHRNTKSTHVPVGRTEVGTVTGGGHLAPASKEREVAIRSHPKIPKPNNKSQVIGQDKWNR